MAARKGAKPTRIPAEQPPLPKNKPPQLPQPHPRPWRCYSSQLQNRPHDVQVCKGGGKNDLQASRAATSPWKTWLSTTATPLTTRCHPPRSTAHPLRNHPTQCLSMSTPATGCPAAWVAASEGREAHAHATRAGSPPGNKHQPRAREVKGAAGLLHPECNWLCTRFCGLHERRQVGASHACWGFRGQKPGWCLARQTQKLGQGCTECGVPGTRRDGRGCSISKQLMPQQSRHQQPRIVHAHLSHKQGKALPQRRLRTGFAAQHGRTAWHTGRGGQYCAWAGRWGLPRWGWYHSMPRPPQHQQASSDSHTQRGVDSTAQAQAAGACQEGEEYQTTRRFTTGMGRGGVGSTMDMHATGGVVGGGMATMPQSLQPQKHEGWAIPRHGACHNGLQEVG